MALDISAIDGIDESFLKLIIKAFVVENRKNPDVLETILNYIDKNKNLFETTETNKRDKYIKNGELDRDELKKQLVGFLFILSDFLDKEIIDIKVSNQHEKNYKNNKVQERIDRKIKGTHRLNVCENYIYEECEMPDCAKFFTFFKFFKLIVKNSLNIGNIENIITEEFIRNIEDCSEGKAEFANIFKNFVEQELEENFNITTNTIADAWLNCKHCRVSFDFDEQNRVLILNRGGISSRVAKRLLCRFFLLEQEYENIWETAYQSNNDFIKKLETFKLNKLTIQDII